ncbi:hypothetical protein [Thalassotalea euphylliae]|uniref:hypothetical protein n=1 Tax=Thalassotalea euphylliae TaxID=1655234 RepID=UPI0011C040B0|nr:hypothetical protein [Thalassotalea euphylliae]
MVSFCYQVFSLPLLMAFLGVEKYAIFAIFLTSIGWVFWLSNSLSPAVTRITARNGITQIAHRVYLAAKKVTFFIAVVAVVGGAVLTLVQLNHQVMSHFNLHDVLLLLLLSLLVMYYSVADSVRQGVGQQHINNLYFSGANAITIVSIFVIAKMNWHESSKLPLAIVVTYLPLFIIKVINTFQVNTKFKVKPLTHTYNPKKALLKLLFGVGSANLFIQLSVLTNKSVVSFFVIDASLVEMAKLDIAFRYFTIAGTFFATIQAPLWPLLTNAYKQKEYNWIRMWQLVLTIGFGVISLVLFAVTYLYGEQLFLLWSQAAVVITQQEIMLMSGYFLTIALNQAHIILLMGKSDFAFIAKSLLIEAGVLILLIFSQQFEQSLLGVIQALIVARIISSLPMLSWKVWYQQRGAALES